MITHSFEDRIEFEHSPENISVGEKIITVLWPNAVRFRWNRSSLKLQKRGIDFAVQLPDGYIVTIDWKFRSEFWPDVCCEYISNSQTGDLGWIEKPDYGPEFIGYVRANVDCLMIPYLPFRQFWLLEKQRLLQRPKIRAQNRTYVTWSVPVTVEELKEAIGPSLIHVDLAHIR